MVEERQEEAPVVIPPATPFSPTEIIPQQLPADPISRLQEGIEKRVRGSEAEDLSDLFSVTNEDIMGRKEGEDSDLFSVTDEDVMGEGDPLDASFEDILGYDYSPESKRAPRVTTRPPVVTRRPPPATLGGIREL